MVDQLKHLSEFAPVLLQYVWECAWCEESVRYAGRQEVGMCRTREESQGSIYKIRLHQVQIIL